jgi:hypothetical protein
MEIASLETCDRNDRQCPTANDSMVFLNHQLNWLDIMIRLPWWTSKTIAVTCVFLVSTPALALVDGKKLGELLGTDKTLPLAREYIKGCIFKSQGASTEYWYVIKSKICTNAVGSAFGKEEKYDKVVKAGYGFKIFTVCTSTGTSVHCERKPKQIPFDYVGRCIMPVKTNDGYSGVYCIQGLPNQQADVLLRSLIKEVGLNLPPQPIPGPPLGF